MHTLGPTGRVTLEGRTFELEKFPHHGGSRYAECEKDCPKGWEIPSYQVLQAIRNSPQRDEFSLLMTWEYMQNPDSTSRENHFVAYIDADATGAEIVCNWGPEISDPKLGVRYMREIKVNDNREDFLD